MGVGIEKTVNGITFNESDTKSRTHRIIYDQTTKEVIAFLDRACVTASKHKIFTGNEAACRARMRNLSIPEVNVETPTAHVLVGHP